MKEKLVQYSQLVRDTPPARRATDRDRYISAKVEEMLMEYKRRKELAVQC